PQDGDLAGHLFVTSGLGGMSGAQPKAIEIARGVGIVAEVDASRIKTRHDQGWVSLVIEDAAEAFRVAQEYMDKKETISIAYHGNIVDLLQYAVRSEEHTSELQSRFDLVCRLLLEKKKIKTTDTLSFNI